MRYLIPGLTAAFLLTATSLGACQSVKKTETTASQMQTSQPSQKTPQTAQNVSTQKKIVNSAPDDWIVTEDEVWIPVVDGLGQHLHSARQSFVNRDNKASATQIREAAAFLKRESGRASSKSKAPIEKAIANLEKLAGEVESGKITSVAQLDPVFVEAYQADSEHIWVMVDEQQWFPVVEKPSQHWRNARENFLKKDNQAAAQEIHKGIAFLKLEAHRASEEEKSALSASAQELDKLAAEVKQNEVSDVKILDRAFAKGQFALARFYEVQAARSESQGESVKAGYELKAAAHHLESGANWIGKETGTKVTTTVEDARLVADKLIQGNKPETTELNKAMTAVNEQIKTLNEEVQTAER